jgi:hypothetical protein
MSEPIAFVLVEAAANRSGLIATPLFDLDLHVQLAAGREMRNDVFGIDNLDVVGHLDITRRDDAFALLLDVEPDLFLRMQLEDDALQIEQNVDYVFLDAVERGVLVEYTRDLDFRGGRTGHRREQYTPQRIAERVAVSALERFHDHFGVGRGIVLDVDDAWLQ